MSSKPQGRLVVLSGPTASGKSTLWRRLVAHEGVTFSVSATTRQPRSNEEDGRDYRFLTEVEFMRLKEEGSFLEHALVHQHWYGTLRSDVTAALESGKDLVLEIDVQGFDLLQQSGLPCLSFFVMPPSLEILSQRLAKRGTEDSVEMANRLAVSEKEMARAEQYDHVVINDDLERMVREVESILGFVEAET